MHFKMNHNKQSFISLIYWKIFIQLFLCFINGRNCVKFVDKSVEPMNVPCSFLDSINITDAKLLKNGSYLYDGIVYPSNLVGIYDYQINNEPKIISTDKHLRGCICKLRSCTRMCCKKHQINEDCEYYPDYFSTDISVTHLPSGDKSYVDIYQNFGVVHGMLCEGTYYLEPEKYESDRWELLEDGTLLKMDDLKKYTKDEYCLSPLTLENSSEIVINPAFCFIEVKAQIKDLVYAYAMLFSVPFIIVTIVVYITIPELRNLHGKSLICYLSGLAVGYSVLSFILITAASTVSNIWCSVLGYIIYYSFMSSFLWLSVISFDLWWNFRGTRGINRLNESKRFLLYSLYSWGIAGIFLVSIIFIQNSNIPVELKPGIGGGDYCWLDVKLWIQIVYFYGPIMIIFAFNITMFVLTSMKIHRVQREMAKIIAKEDSRRNLHGEKDKFGLFLRLFIVMGVTWTLETLSWLIGYDSVFSKVFFLTDICNAIQGFMIFALFVLKRKVKYLILKRYNSIRGFPQRTSTYSTKTTSSNLTMTVIAIDRLIVKNEMNTNENSNKS